MRPMTAAEFRTYAEEMLVKVVGELGVDMPEAQARAEAERGLAKHLPDGVETPRHTLLIAEDAAGAPVGNAWLGPDPHRTDATDRAWLFGINVYPQVRGRGFGAAILAAAEELAGRAGNVRLGLNVYGGNEVAIGLYRTSGYAITTQQMSKPLSPPGEHVAP